MSNDEIETFKRRRVDHGIFRTIPFAAWISAASLAWYVGVSWVNFRDLVFANCHRVELRLAALDEYRIAHERADAERFGRVLRLEDQSAEFAESRREGWKEFDHRIRVLERRESGQ